MHQSSRSITHTQNSPSYSRVSLSERSLSLHSYELNSVSSVCKQGELEDDEPRVKHSAKGAPAVGLFRSLLRSWGLDDRSHISIELLESGVSVTYSLERVGHLLVDRLIELVLKEHHKKIISNIKSPCLPYHRRFFQLRRLEGGSPLDSEPVDPHLRVVDLRCSTLAMLEAQSRELQCQDSKSLFIFSKHSEGQIVLKVTFQNSFTLTLRMGQDTALRELYNEVKKKDYRFCQKEYIVTYSYCEDEFGIDPDTRVGDLESCQLFLKPKRFRDEPAHKPKPQVALPSLNSGLAPQTYQVQISASKGKGSVFTKCLLTVDSEGITVHRRKSALLGVLNLLFSGLTSGESNRVGFPDVIKIELQQDEVTVLVKHLTASGGTGCMFLRSQTHLNKLFEKLQRVLKLDYGFM